MSLTQTKQMDTETIKALGEYIVEPLCVLGVLVSLFYFANKK